MCLSNGSLFLPGAGGEPEGTAAFPCSRKQRGAASGDSPRPGPFQEPLGHRRRALHHPHTATLPGQHPPLIKLQKKTKSPIILELLCFKII